jgi:chromosome segregation ATPase
MSLEKIDEYIRELEAIKNYDRVKAERDSLLARVKELEASLSSEREKVEELHQIIKSLEEQVRVKSGEIESLKSELAAKDERIKSLEEDLNNLSSRLKELEEFRAIVEGKTLGEAREAFMKAMEDEIEKRAQERFSKFKSEWEEKDKPREVSSKAITLLRRIIEQLGKPEPCSLPEGVKESGLLEKIEEILSSEVKRRIDAEFLRRVEEESSRKALEKLEKLKSIEWPNWYKVNIEPRILQLESQIRSNIMGLLRGEWIVKCDKCGTQFRITLTTEVLETLLRSGSISVECPNTNCVDFYLFIPFRHKIELTLRRLIEVRCMG